MEITLDSSLCLFWVAAIFPILLASTSFTCLRPFHRLVSCFAGRGKTSIFSSKWNVPQSYFLHFYIIGVVWNSFLLVCLWCYACGMTISPERLDESSVARSFAEGAQGKKQEVGHAWRTIFLLLLVELQVLRRLYESVFVFKYSASAKMHIFAYLMGLLYYTAMPLSVASSCVCKSWSYIGSHINGTLVNGQEGTLPLNICYSECMKHLLGLHLSEWIGAAIFMWGWIHQFRCHQILGSLRRGRGKDDYVIPTGDWFEFVSSPHYLAEIVLYGGILVTGGGSDTNIWLAFIFVVSNLTFAAAETHRWYLQKFEDYPRSRYAIIPLLY